MNPDIISAAEEYFDKMKRRTERKGGDHSPTTGQAVFQTYKPLILGLFGTFCLVTSTTVIKSLSHLNVETIVITRFIGFFIFNFPILVGSQNQIFNKSSAPLLLTRAVIGSIALILNILAITLMPIADLSIISSTTPIFVCILSKLILKENFDKLNCLSVAFTTLGLIFMSRVFSLIDGSPSDKYTDLNYWLGAACAISNSMLMAFVFIFVRKLQGVPECIILAYQSVVGVIISALFHLVSWKWQLLDCGWDGPWLVLLGFLALLSQTSLTMALKCDKAGATSSVNTASKVAWSFVFQVTIFGDVPDVHSILAAVCVFVSLSLAALRKRRQHKRRKSRVKLEMKETRV